VHHESWVVQEKLDAIKQRAVLLKDDIISVFDRPPSHKGCETCKMSCLHQQQQTLQGLAGSYELGTTLGEGAFGKVLLAISSAEPCLGWQPTAPSSLNGRQVVVKQVSQHCT
jgi:serine/threonine protein kinase